MSGHCKEKLDQLKLMFFGPFLSKTSPLDQILPSLRQQGGGELRNTSRFVLYTALLPWFAFFSTAVSMARRKGSVHYTNKVLIQLIIEILPNGEYGWQAVAMTYQERTKEEALRNCTDLKKHWINNLCNNMRKLMG